MRPKKIKNLQTRSKKLMVRVIDPVEAHDPFIVIVGSSSNSNFNRIVTIKFEPDGRISARCTCKWAEHGGVGCSHVLAALNRLATRKKRILSFWLTVEEAQRQKQRVFQLSANGGQEKLWITSRHSSPTELSALHFAAS